MISCKYIHICMYVLTFYDNCVLFQVRTVLFCFGFLFHNFITLSSLIYIYEACVRMNTWKHVEKIKTGIYWIRFMYLCNLFFYRDIIQRNMHTRQQNFPLEQEYEIIPKKFDIKKILCQIYDDLLDRKIHSNGVSFERKKKREIDESPLGFSRYYGFPNITWQIYVNLLNFKSIRYNNFCIF